MYFIITLILLIPLRTYPLVFYNNIKTRPLYAGIDDAPSECDLDQYNFKHVLHNDGTREVEQISEYEETLSWAAAFQ